MKIYTEEQLRKAIMIAENQKIPFTTIVTERLTPIELPSDEEIEKQNPFVWGSHIFGTRDLLIWEQGAKWMRDKIQEGNK